MAAAFVGGALLSAFLKVAFDRLASPQVLDFFRRRKLDEKLLANLNIKLHSINALADDAELKQLTDPHVKAWLVAVKEAVFDAEDLLGEIDYELTRCQVKAQSKPQTCTYKVSNIFNSIFTPFNKKIEFGMKEVLEKLEYLANQKGDLRLKEGTYSGDGSVSNMPQKLPSSSLVVESVIYGRDADKDIIFNWLTSETDNPNQPSILSIVGMGGLGKTTLAQHVYSDPKIEDAKFDIKAWVCVSDHFHVLTMTRTILEAITNEKDDSVNLQMVHKKLKEKLSGKKFLLVLDDVWNERPAEWEAVRTPLSYGAPGSRILVTTRSEKVASSMRSEVHLLKQLGEDECWKVFENHALKDGGIELNDELMKVGRRIVEKCKGLPLALKTIGRLLSTKSSISDWKNILESNIWELPKEHSEIIPALFLSYRHLPSHLKRCFAYCALFPKDYEFVKEELIFLWMAQNFLLSPQQIRHPEEVGEEYFNDLLSRCFFNQSSIVGRFVMHDLLNDLAKYVCADFCFRLKFDNEKCMPKTTRNFSFEFCDVKSFDGFESLTDAKRLRSFLPIPEACRGTKVRKMPMHFGELKNLRVLNPVFVDRNSELSTKQLGGLNQHGRLSINDVQNISNPLDALGANMKDKHLVELELQWKWDHIPDDARKENEVLQNLQPSNHLENLSMSNYSGTKFPSWVSDNSLSNLVFLELRNCKYCLCLPSLGLLSSLKTLEIEGFDGIVSVGAEFYGSNSSFASLERLEFRNMKEWEEWECKTTSFPRLEWLSVYECPKLKGTKVVVSDELRISGNSMDTSHTDCPQFKSFLFPSLTTLDITNCPEVELFPDGGLPLNIKHISLSSLKLIASLRDKLDPNTSLQTLSMRYLELECFPDEVLLPRSLTSLIIYNCSNLKKMHCKGLCHLSSLILEDCPSLECLPAEGLPKSISSLIIVNCPLIKERCRNPDGEDWGKIAHIQKLYVQN
ncbi:hypothetical protein PHAVU_004G009800 [Phaseolus vulgaris]